MRTLLSVILIAFFTFENYAQSPQSFQYQAVVRDASGTALVNQSVNFQISIISGSVSGTIEYVETHAGSTNGFGIVTLQVGTGTATQGSFSSIDWGTNSYFVKVEADPAGGTSYLDMGTTQLLSVPYALYAEKAGNIPLYTGGVGIDVSGTTITNLAPDQVVNITSGTGVSVSGTYPNFNIDNTAPDQQVTLTGTGATSISGTYPDFIISSTDTNTTYSAGTGIDVTGTTITNTAPDQPITLTGSGATTITGVYPDFTINSTDNNTSYWSLNGNNIFNNNLGNVGIGFNNPSYMLHINNASGASNMKIGDTYTNFDNKLYFGDGSYVYIGEETIDDRLSVKSGSLAINITAGGGFGTAGQVLKSNGTTVSWQNDNNAGTPGGANKQIQFNNSGSFGGDAALIWDNSNKRLGIGSATPSGRVVIQGSSTASPAEPLFEIKNSAGQQIMAVYNDSIHFFITDIGANKGGFAVSGRNSAKALTNDFLRLNADSTRIYTSDINKGFGVRNINGAIKERYMQITPNNYFIGHQSGISTTGIYNIFIGYQAGQFNTTGQFNVFVGHMAGMSNTTGNYNCGYGFRALTLSTTGSNNTALGHGTLRNSTTGNNNTTVGYLSMYSNATGYDNSAFGYQALCNNSIGINNTAVGVNTLFSNITGNNNSAFGNGAFMWGDSYTNSTALGSAAGINASNKVRIGDSFVSVIEGQVAFSSVSDGRFKYNVTEEVKGLDFILKLRPVVYNFDKKKFDDFINKDMPDSVKTKFLTKKDYTKSTNIRETGFIAQEIEQAAKESGYDFNGLHIPVDDKDNYSVAYSLFTVPLVKGMQEQQRMIEKLQKENKELQNVNSELLKRIEKIENQLNK